MDLTTKNAFKVFLQPRIDRVNLDTKKCYTRVHKVNGSQTQTYVGQFVRSYTMGSGDGMTVHLEFNDNGTITTIGEEMWGSVSGDELSHFIETVPSTKSSE
jgi:hypothetical protein